MILAAVGPKISLMFPIWMFGVFGYRLCDKLNISPLMGLIMFISSITAGYMYINFVHASLDERNTVSFQIWLNLLLKDYLIGLIFLTNIVSFRALSIWLPSAENKIGNIIKWLAGGTFSLYLLHEPFVRFFATLSPFPRSSLEGRCMVVGGTLAIVFLAAELTERRKLIWRRGVTFLFDLVGNIVSRKHRGAHKVVVD
jgi:peptidoglycan/LPS O-acetylase OafA/YrhL